MVGGVCVTSPYKTGIKLGVTQIMVSESHGHTKINNGIMANFVGRFPNHEINHPPSIQSGL